MGRRKTPKWVVIELRTSELHKCFDDKDLIYMLTQLTDIEPDPWEWTDTLHNDSEAAEHAKEQFRRNCIEGLLVLDSKMNVVTDTAAKLFLDHIVEQSVALLSRLFDEVSEQLAILQEQAQSARSNADAGSLLALRDQLESAMAG